MSSDALPPLYSAWVTELLGAPLPDESEATCGQCPMLPSPHAPPNATFFNPQTKCCTYLPLLHNFLVGRVLREPESPGRGSVIARIERGVEVSPKGLGRPQTFLTAYQTGGGATFGRSREMRCPHYLDDGGCGVWLSRESTCATWFCKHVRGQTGHDIWHALHVLLAQLERSLAAWCTHELGTTDDWGAWHGRELAFFLSCADLVDALAWSEVLEIGGRGAIGYAAELRRLVIHSQVKDVPERLVLGKHTVVATSGDTSTVLTYNAYDPFELPAELLAALPRFDGRTTVAVLAEIEEQCDLELEPELMRRLVDFGILVPPSATAL